MYQTRCVWHQAASRSAETTQNPVTHASPRQTHPRTRTHTTHTHAHAGTQRHTNNNMHTNNHTTTCTLTATYATCTLTTTYGRMRIRAGKEICSGTILFLVASRPRFALTHRHRHAQRNTQTDTQTPIRCSWGAQSMCVCIKYVYV